MHFFNFDRRMMKKAIKLSKKSHQDKDHGDKTDPKVGAVLVTKGRKIYTSFRAESMDGDHAEYNLLENKSKSIDLNGATLYVTLEPCSEISRTLNSCSLLVVQKRIKRIVIGMLDPNPDIYAKSIQYMKDNGIEVRFFDYDLQNEIHKLNEEFIIEQKINDESRKIKSFILENFDKNALMFLYENSSVCKNIEDLIGLLHAYYGIKKANKQYECTRDFELALCSLDSLSKDKATIKIFDCRSGIELAPKVIDGPLLLATNEYFEYLADLGLYSKLHSFIPFNILKETFVNAIIHRDYERPQSTTIHIYKDYLQIGNPCTNDQEKIDAIINLTAQSVRNNQALAKLAEITKLINAQNKGMEDFRKETKYKPVFSYHDHTLFTIIKY